MTIPLVKPAPYLNKDGQLVKAVSIEGMIPLPVEEARALASLIKAAIAAMEEEE